MLLNGDLITFPGGKHRHQPIRVGVFLLWRLLLSLQLTDNGAKFPTRVSLHWVSIFLSPCSHIYHSLAVWPWGSHFTFLFWNFFIYKVKAVLGWPESLFGFFHTILDINLNELFGQPNKIIYIKDCADVDFRKIQKEKNNYHILMHIYGI